MMMALYDLDARIRALQAELNEEGDYVDPETGEVIPFEQALAALNMEKSQMIEEYACLAKELVAMASDIGEEEKKLARRRYVLEAQVEKIKNCILSTCWGAGEKKPDRFTAPRATVSFALNAPSTIIDDAAQLPEVYVVKKITTAPDKKAIKEAILAGETIPGAHLERSRRVSIG